MTAFDKAFAIVVAAEGGFSNDPKDPGNWTGPGCTGECRGTKYGISARVYPNLDIAALDMHQVEAIYRRDYWDRIKGDQLPAPVALLMFDAAVNNGVGKAIVWLQAAVGTAQDGILGPVTLAAVTDDKFPCEVCVEFQAQRMNYMGGLPMWKTYGLGWSRRLAEMSYETFLMENT